MSYKLPDQESQDQQSAQEDLGHQEKSAGAGNEESTPYSSVSMGAASLSQTA